MAFDGVKVMVEEDFLCSCRQLVVIAMIGPLSVD